MFQVKKVLFSALIALLSFVSITTPMQNKWYDRVAGSLFGAAIGDGLGGFTEFEPAVYDGGSLQDSTDAVNQMFSRGLIMTSADLKGVYAGRVAFLKKQGLISPAKGVAISYTDDTAMSIVVMDTLLKARQHNWDLHKTMTEMAQAFCTDYHAPKGWAAAGRAPGGACKNGIKILEERINNKQTNKPQWWRAGNAHAGGCGSVMRAHPFGLVFADDINKAETWAVEHSRLTHQDPIALASCAAMAVGTALALRQEDPDVVVQQMIAVAKKYDHADLRTVKKMQRAYQYAQEMRKLLEEECITSVYRLVQNKKFIALHSRVFHEFKGWGAHEAIAAAIYIFALVADHPDSAILYGVHTPGDSDSIASLAGALVGARMGVKHLNSQNVQEIEGRDQLKKFAQATVALPKYNPAADTFKPLAAIPVVTSINNTSNLPDDVAAKNGMWATLTPIKTCLGLFSVGVIGYALYKLYGEDKKSDANKDKQKSDDSAEQTK